MSTLAKARAIVAARQGTLSRGTCLMVVTRDTLPQVQTNGAGGMAGTLAVSPAAAHHRTALRSARKQQGQQSTHQNTGRPTRALGQTADDLHNRLAADLAATRFLAWMHEFEAGRDWPDDALWYIATEDFAPANDVELPPREEFLDAVQALTKELR